MSEVTKLPTHFRLLAAFKAIGPYVREELCKDGYYWFDCLSVCIDDKKAPEKREFWGWWMELTTTESGFKVQYHVGMYNQAGDWVNKEPPEKDVAEIIRTRDDFEKKLHKMLEERFAQTISAVE
ncbi:sigma factor-binding protein Crl [Vibrio sp. CAIM 722]|uniref:Sigma factor-binding protein Crl n=1 Tax=Vibrio eleionomae TaxID=2653505 RepID=A0A7X4LGV8_9VIBR|nr:sigma factor-binding protein Crl [Vibrio eleionomae]MZI91684.1 sigma factor-binding protein Crl [Vibrio eleionomae]